MVLLKINWSITFYQQLKIVVQSNNFIPPLFIGGLVHGPISLCCFTNSTYTGCHIARKSGRNTLLSQSKFFCHHKSWGDENNTFFLNCFIHLAIDIVLESYSRDNNWSEIIDLQTYRRTYFIRDTLKLLYDNIRISLS